MNTKCQSKLGSSMSRILKPGTENKAVHWRLEGAETPTDGHVKTARGLSPMSSNTHPIDCNHRGSDNIWWGCCGAIAQDPRVRVPMTNCGLRHPVEQLRPMKLRSIVPR